MKNKEYNNILGIISNVAVIIIMTFVYILGGIKFIHLALIIILCLQLLFININDITGGR